MMGLVEPGASALRLMGLGEISRDALASGFSLVLVGFHCGAW